MCLVRCVCHAVPVEGFGCRGVHECTLVDCCMSAVLEDCGLFVVGAICEESCSDSYHIILLGKWPSTVVGHNFLLQSTLTPFVV